jgi:hypothetical protein
LLEVNRRKPNLKNRTDEVTEQSVLAFTLENPAFGQKRTSDELRRRGVFISAGGVRCVWLRNGLETFAKRLRYLEEHIARTGDVLTERQLLALERAKEEKIAYGEIETEHVGYLGSSVALRNKVSNGGFTSTLRGQDTFYVGIIKGVGRVYQQTFIDTYSGVGFAKLYTTKQAITAADVLNDMVLPFFDRYNLPLLRILTDRGTEYCGKADEHDYQLFLAVNDIDHTKTKTKSPQTNGICERFNKTILEEFYMLAFRKKIYNSIEELQTDLDKWLVYYNESRPHQGKRQQGRTPMETFMDNLGYALGKNHAMFTEEFAVGDDLTVTV